MNTKIAALVVGSLIAVGGITSGILATQSAATTLTGTKSLDCAVSGQCAPFAAFTCSVQAGNGPNDPFVLYLNGNNTTYINGHSYDGFKIKPGCTGDIEVHVINYSADAIKVVGGNDLTITGTVTCPGIAGGSHQDGMQALSGNDIHFTNFNFACDHATNAQFFVQASSDQSDQSLWPHDVTCDQCEFHPNPTHYHVVTIGRSVNSGVTNSLICPGSVKDYVYGIASSAINPINDESNILPDHGQDGCS
jgi:hypothetical protein